MAFLYIYIYTWTWYFWRCALTPVNRDRIFPWVIYFKHCTQLNFKFSIRTCFSIYNQLSRYRYLKPRFLTGIIFKFVMYTFFFFFNPLENSCFNYSKVWGKWLLWVYNCHLKIQLDNSSLFSLHVNVICM